MLHAGISSFMTAVWDGASLQNRLRLNDANFSTVRYKGEFLTDIKRDFEFKKAASDRLKLARLESLLKFLAKQNKKLVIVYYQSGIA